MCCVLGHGLIQYSIVVFCVLCFRPWSDTIQYCIVLCAVFQAIKTDVVRSLCTRCELLSEDLELTDEISGEVISVIAGHVTFAIRLISVP